MMSMTALLSQRQNLAGQIQENQCRWGKNKRKKQNKRTKATGGATSVKNWKELEEYIIIENRNAISLKQLASVFIQ